MVLGWLGPAGSSQCRWSLSTCKEHTHIVGTFALHCCWITAHIQRAGWVACLTPRLHLHAQLQPDSRVLCVALLRGVVIKARTEEAIAQRLLPIVLYLHQLFLLVSAERYGGRNPVDQPNSNQGLATYGGQQLL